MKGFVQRKVIALCLATVLLTGCEPIIIERRHSDEVTHHVLVPPDDAVVQEVLAAQLDSDDLDGVARTMRSLRTRMPSDASYSAVHASWQQLSGRAEVEHEDYWYALAAATRTLAHYRLNGYPVGDDFAADAFPFFETVLRVGDSRARLEALGGIGTLGVDGSSRVLAEHAMKTQHQGDFAGAVFALVSTCDPDADQQLDAMASSTTDQNARIEIEAARQSRLKFWSKGRRICDNEFALPPWEVEPQHPSYGSPKIPAPAAPDSPLGEHKPGDHRIRE